MIAAINDRRPASIQFLSTATDGLYTLEVKAQTNAATDVAIYRSALQDLGTLQTVDVRDQNTRGGTMTFTLVVTFKPDSLRVDAVEQPAANPS